MIPTSTCFSAARIRIGTSQIPRSTRSAAVREMNESADPGHPLLVKIARTCLHPDEGICYSCAHYWTLFYPEQGVTTFFICASQARIRGRHLQWKGVPTTVVS